MRNLIYSNCLIEAIRLKILYPSGKIKCDRNCPSGGVSFFFENEGLRYRFRRKLRRYSNKSKILFVGYRVVEEIKKVENEKIQKSSRLVQR